MVKILLVEDEPHKREEITVYLRDFLGPSLELEQTDSVRSAVISVSQNDFDLIVLDMALPTFSSDDESSDGGQDQALGGIEVLRALKQSQRNSRVIIVTQHPEISVGGRTRVKLKDARVALSKRYGLTIAGVVLYSYRSPNNRSRLLVALEKKS